MRFAPLILSFVCLGLWTPVQAAPANDNFANAQVLLAGQTVTGSNVGATKEAGEPNHAFVQGGRSIWWFYDATAAGFLTISTAGSKLADGSEFDTVLGIYTGASFASFAVVASNDDDEDSDAFTSKATFPIQSGVRYYVAVDGYDYDTGVEQGQIVLTATYQEKLPTTPAPSWSLPDINGATVRSTDFNGKVTLVNFWATWCGPCVDEIPDLVELHNEYEKFGFAVIGISIDDAVSTQPPTTLVRNFADQYGMNYPVVMSRPRSTVESDFGDISAIPTTFLVDRENNIVSRVVGSRNKAFFEALVKPHLLNSIVLGVRSEGENTIVEWPTVPGTVQLEQATTLGGAWTSSSQEAVVGENSTTVTIPRSGSAAFYRLRITL